MSESVLVCGAVFDGVSEDLAGRTEILVRDGLLSEMGHSVDRPDGAQVIDLSERTVSPGFIDTHVHLTMDASDLPSQTLESTAARRLRVLASRSSIWATGSRRCVISAAWILSSRPSTCVTPSTQGSCRARG